MNSGFRMIFLIKTTLFFFALVQSIHATYSYYTLQLCNINPSSALPRSERTVDIASARSLQSAILPISYNTGGTKVQPAAPLVFEQDNNCIIAS